MSLYPSPAKRGEGGRREATVGWGAEVAEKVPLIVIF